MNTSTPQSFGGEWTRKKLDIFGGYLSSYRAIFDKNERARHLRTIYIDAFAGSGACDTCGNAEDAEIADSAQAIVDGSTRLALGHVPGFDVYVFIDTKQSNVRSLERLREEFPHHADKIEIRQQDANIALLDICRRTDWRTHRAVVFLDPFGMQADWDIVEELGKTKAVDLWYLFPIGTLNRMLPKSGLPPEVWCDTITRLLGTPDWNEAFYQPSRQPGLFSDTVELDKAANWDSMSTFVMRRLSTSFGATTPPDPILLRNTTNTPLFMLCFASANPKGSVIASKIAKHLLNKGVASGG